MSLPLGPYRSFIIPDEEITWAGECPWNQKPCFGTKSGKVVFLVPGDADQPDVFREFQVASEAVNDVAFWNDLIALATRSEVLVYRGPFSSGELSRTGGLAGRAYGIVATPRGRFLAPMGTAGLFRCDGEQAAKSQGWVDRPAHHIYNYYKAVYLGERDGKEILACAARNDGLARIEVGATKASRVVSLTAPSVDLISVCPLVSEENPFAVAGLGLDCSLVLVRDILALSEKSPMRLKLERLRGKPHSLLYALGHLVVVTNAEIVIFPDLASRFLAGEALDHPIDACRSTVQAVDAFIAGEKFLMVITHEGVRVSEILPAGLTGHDRSSSVSKVKVLDWSNSRDILRPVPTHWATRVA